MAGRRVSRFWRALAAAAIVLLLPLLGSSVRSAVGAAPPDTVINFDNFSDGTVLSSQYKGSGVVFSGSPTVTASSHAHSSPNVVAVDGGCEAASVFGGSFSQAHERVQAYVGSNGRADTEITLSGLDANGTTVASSKVDIPSQSGLGASTFISVSVSSALISGFMLTSDQSCEPLYADDLAFDSPSATLNVTVNPTGGGTVTGSGISCPGDCSEVYATGAQVQLTAAADTADGYTFAGWGGGCASAGTNTVCNVTMDSDTSVTASFTPPPNTHTLTVTTTGAGTVSGAGIDCPGDCSGTYKDGTSVTLVATPGSNATFTGWGGACSGTGDCKLTLTADKTVSAMFTGTSGGGAQSQKLSVTSTGPGSVSSSPAGIGGCRGSCSAAFTSGSTVTLTATPDAGSTFAGWGGACSGNGTCALTMSGDRTATATFTGTGQSASVDPVIVKDPTPLPPEVTIATANPADPSQVVEVQTGETGNGVVTQLGRTTTGVTAAGKIACGVTQFECYARLKPGTTILLRAKAQPGYVFRGWNGSCSGQGPLCRIVARSLVSTWALFLPRNPVESLGLAVTSPRIKVKWALSTGTGTIALSGRVGGPAGLLLQVRRPAGGVLERIRFTAKGKFSKTLRLPKDILPRGARLLPGAFVASLRGTSARAGLPVVVRPLVVPSPREGVVRIAFASASNGGPPTARLPSGQHQAWANFNMQTQPSLKLPLRVRWYRPDKTVLGDDTTVSNRPEVTSEIDGGNLAIAKGTWVAELRAGSQVVKRLNVQIG